MVILRALRTIVITPFHPIYGFGLYQDEHKQQLQRRLIFYIMLIFLCVSFYFLAQARPSAFTDNTFLSTLTYFFTKVTGVFLYFFIAGICSLIFKLNDGVMPFQMLTATLVFAILPEIFLCSVFFSGHSTIRKSGLFVTCG